jgi:protein-S-isoprenylcysteine O-methyltransferase Ste14
MQRFMKYPPLVTLLFMLCVLFTAQFTQRLHWQVLGLDWLAYIIGVIAMLLIISGGLQFRTVNTTVDPTTPEKTSSLVTTGIYSYTRNPMYLGLLGFLLMESLLLGSLLSLLWLPVYIMTMNNRFIKPEESALLSLFEQEFMRYQLRVRRWV